MKAPYTVVYKGTWFKAGTELPDEVAKAIKPDLEAREKFENELEEYKRKNMVVKANITYNTRLF